MARAYNIAAEDVVHVLHFLHNIGEVAYFDDDPTDGLVERVFLVRLPSFPHLLLCGRAEAAFLSLQDPQWLTNVMSSVVTLRHNIVRYASPSPPLRWAADAQPQGGQASVL